MRWRKIWRAPRSPEHALVGHGAEERARVVIARDQPQQDGSQRPERLVLLYHEQEHGHQHAQALAVPDHRQRPRGRVQHPSKPLGALGVHAAEVVVVWKGAEQVLLDLRARLRALEQHVRADHQLVVSQRDLGAVRGRAAAPQPDLPPEVVRHAVDQHGAHRVVGRQRIARVRERVEARVERAVGVGQVPP